MVFHCVAVAKKTAMCKLHSDPSLSEHTSQIHIKTYSDSLQQKYSNNDTISNHNHLQQYRGRGNKNKLYIKSVALQTNMRSSIGLNPLPSHTLMGKGLLFVCRCLCVRYLQQASAPREVWLSKLLSVSEVMVGSLLGSVGSVDMDETSLAEEEGEEAG